MSDGDSGTDQHSPRSNSPNIPAPFAPDFPRESDELTWQATPGGGPLVFNQDGSLGVSNSPVVRQHLFCDPILDYPDGASLTDCSSTTRKCL